MLNPATVRRSPFNRNEFDPVEMKTLIDDVKANGVIQPGIVRPNPGTTVQERDGVFVVTSNRGGTVVASVLHAVEAKKLSEELNRYEWELIAGERRWTAATAAKAEFPATVRDVDDTGALELQAIENMHREDLNPIDEAEKYEQLRAAYELEGMTRTDAVHKIEEKTGKAESTIYERLSLATLPHLVRSMIKRREIPASHAGLLTKLKDPKTIERLAAEIRKGEGGEVMPFRESKKKVEEAVKVEKNLADWMRKKQEFEKLGHPVLDLKLCAKFLHGSSWNEYWDIRGGEFVKADDRPQIPGANYRPYEKLWKKAPTPTLGRLPNGRAVLIYAKVDADAAVKAGNKLKKETSAGYKKSASELADEKRDKDRREEFFRVIGGVISNVEQNLDSADFWRLFTSQMLCGRYSQLKDVAKRRGWPKSNDYAVDLEKRLPELGVQELRGLCLEVILIGDAPTHWHSDWQNGIKKAAAFCKVPFSPWAKPQASGDGKSGAEDAGEGEDE